MDLIDRLRTYASTRKGELAELITEAADALERQTCDDAVSRQQAIDALAEQMPLSFTPDGSHPADEGIFRAQEIYADCIETIELLPAVQPQTEIIRCKDCKYWREHKYAKETKRYIPFCGFNAINTKADDYCSSAERRTDEQTDRH